LGLAVGLCACDLRGRDGLQPAAPQTELISRELLFGRPDRAQVRISPDGRMLSFLAPRDGGMALWLAPVSSPGQARLISGDARDVTWHAWAPDGRLVLYMRRGAGEADGALFSVDLSNGQRQSLGAGRIDILGLSARDPSHAIVALNERDPVWRDVYSIDLRTGERTVLLRNERKFSDFLLDRNNRVRLATRMVATGELQFWARRSDQEEWSLLMSAPFEDSQSTRPLAFDSEGKTFLMLDSVGRDRTALVRVNADTGEKSVLGESPRADVADVWIDAESFEPQAFAAEYLKLDWQPLSAEGKADIDYLKERLDGEPIVTSRSKDDSRWIILEDHPTLPPRIYLYERRDNRYLRLLFNQRPQLTSEPLQPMIPVEINARDGLTLVSYLTLPPGSDLDGNGRPDAPQPLVLLVHDGPWSRDRHAFRADHQWLANRGYAVLSPNFRGSSGFGKAFANAGNREWGAKMQQDLIDAVDWAVARGVARPDAVASYGAGYGGYATLLALSDFPETFACGVAIAPPADLESYLSAARFRSELDTLALRVGDPRSPSGRALLRERSLARRAGRIEDPLLIVRPLAAEAGRRQALDQAVATAAETAAVTYLEFAEDGAAVPSEAQAIGMRAVAEGFLAQCLGGRSEPPHGEVAQAGLRVRLNANPALDRVLETAAAAEEISRR